MSHLSTTLLSNALLVLPLGLLVFLVTRWLRHPGLAWALWGLVLLKFVTPAIWSLPIDLPASSGAVDTIPVPQQSRPVPAPPPASDSDAATSSDRRPAPTSAEFQQPRVDPEADLAETRAPLMTEPLSPSGLEPANSLAIADQGAIVPSVVSTTTLTGDDIDTQPATGSDEAATDRTPLAPAPAVAPVETVSENERAAALSIRFTQLASRIPQRAYVWLWSVWIAGSLIAVTIAAVRVVRFRRLLAQAMPADAQTLAEAAALAAPLGVRRVPELRVTDGRIPPLLYGGVRRTVILLPRQLLATLDAESRRTLLAHELAHIARRDHWTRWLELLVRCLYWWHPLAWYAGRRLRDAEEQCCDARVVALLPGSAAAYARTILTTVDYLAGHSQAVPTLATGLQPLRRSVRPLHRRLIMIVETQPKRRLSWASRLLIVGLAAGVLPISLLARSDETSPTVDDPSQDVQETSDRGDDLDTAGPQMPAIVIDTTDGSQLTADSLRLRLGDRINILAKGEAEADGDETREPAKEQQETTITVQRKSYAIDGTIGQSVVRLLEQMQRSGLVDPLMAHLNSGNGAAWDGEQWNYQTSVTVITSPAAHEAIGAFIDGLRALRPAPGQSGPEELQIRRVVYDREASWSTSRELAGLLGEAVKAGHIGYVQITSDANDRMVITTTDPVHKVLGPFVDFLSEQQAKRDAAIEGAPANSLAGGALPPGAAVDATSEIGQAASEPGASSEMQTIPPARAGRSLPGGRSDSEDAFALPGASASYPGGREPAGTPSVLGGSGLSRRSGSAGSAPLTGEMGSARAAVHPQRPQVVTAPRESQEITVVARVYELHPAIVQPLGAFLEEVRDGLPIFSGRLVDAGSGGYSGMSGYGGGYGEEMMGDAYGMDMSAAMGPLAPPAPTKLRILAPEAAHEVLGKLLKALQPDPPQKKEADSSAAAEPETIVLVRGEYELGPDAAMRFAELLQTCEQHGLATPLMVTRNQTRVKVIAGKDLQAAIRGLISYLSENWKTAGNSPSNSAPVPARDSDDLPGSAIPQSVLEIDKKIAELELEWANETLKATERFVEKGFKTESDFKAAELEVLKARRELERLKSQSAGQQQPSDKEAPATDPQATDDSADRGAARQDDASLRENVSRAVQRAQQYLVSQQSSGGSWSTERPGAHALVLLALAKSGAEDEDTLRTGLEYLRSVKGPEETYDIALMIMAFAAIDNGREDHGRIAVLAKRLEESQNRTEHPGSWGYGRGRSGWYDNSNSLFALLGLHAAAGTGYQIDLATLRRARDHWLRVQVGDREAAEGAGWSYIDAKYSVTGSMTLAGICSLTIIQSLLPEGPADGNAEQDEVQQAIDAGARWLGENFQVRNNPGDANWPLYYLYCLERAGRLSGRQTFGNHAWYREGAQFLVEAQSSRDGTWRSGSPYEQDPIFGTAFGLLFLAVAEKAG